MIVSVSCCNNCCYTDVDYLILYTILNKPCAVVASGLVFVSLDCPFTAATLEQQGKLLDPNDMSVLLDVLLLLFTIRGLLYIGQPEIPFYVNPSFQDEDFCLYL